MDEDNSVALEKLDLVLRTLKTAKEEREIFEKYVVSELSNIKRMLHDQDLLLNKIMKRTEHLARDK